MAKTFFLSLLILSKALLQAQEVTKNSSATVAVTVTDFKGRLQKAETVLFVSEKDATTHSCKTDAFGKCTITVPAGDTYTIKLKTLTDTALYSRLEIPALQTGRFYSKPFTVEIEFEPPRSFTLNNVHFDTGKPTLRSESFAALNEIAEYMNGREEERYEIAGHTDDVGKDEDNRKLSQARALTVKKYLVSKGISAIRINAKGYGETKPVADNATEEGKKLNRRTELVIL